jgi:hypothetical protein
MELVFTSFVGTFVIMAFELREFLRRRYTATPTAPRFATVCDPHGRTGVPYTVRPAEEACEAAA